MCTTFEEQTRLSTRWYERIDALWTELYNQPEGCIKHISNHGSEATDIDRNELNELYFNNAPPFLSNCARPHRNTNRTRETDINEHYFNDTVTVRGTHRLYRRYKRMRLDSNQGHDVAQRDLNATPPVRHNYLNPIPTPPTIPTAD